MISSGTHFYQRCAPRLLSAALFLFIAFIWVPQPAHTFPQRIISTSPSITETLFALGVGDRVVGVTDFCSFPEEACRLPKIGGLLNPSVEAWIQLKPDLIIHQETSHKLESNARNLGIPTLSVSLKSMKSIYHSISLLGEKLGCTKAAQKLTDTLRSGIGKLRTRLKGIHKKSVLLLLADSDHPGRDLYAVGPRTFLGELLELAGGENIIEESPAEYPKISKEFIIHKSPEIIILAGPKSRLSDDEKSNRLKSWNRFASVRAVQTGDIHFIGAPYILIPGPRLLNIVNSFAQALHPQLFHGSAP